MKEEKTYVGEDIDEICRRMYRKVGKGKSKVSSITAIVNGVRIIMFHESES